MCVSVCVCMCVSTWPFAIFSLCVSVSKSLLLNVGLVFAFLSICLCVYFTIVADLCLSVSLSERQISRTNLCRFVRKKLKKNLEYEARVNILAKCALPPAGWGA